MRGIMVSSLGLALSLLLCLAPTGCSDEDQPPGGDGAPASDGGGGNADTGGTVADGPPAPASDGGSLATLGSAACKRLIASCNGEADPLGQAWTAHIVPWTQQACEKIPACFADQTAAKCFERLYGYYLCLANVEPFDCQACLNQYQYIMGACPCIHECDPSCP